MAIPSVTFTPARNYQEALARAAASRGIDSEYWDIFGKRHLTAPEVQKAILESMGVRTGTVEELNKAMEDRLWGEWSRITPPVHVVSERLPAEVTIRVPDSLADQTVTAEITWESAQTAQVHYQIKHLVTSRTATLRGQQFVEKRLPLPGWTLGYHRIRVAVPDAEGVEGAALLIVTPERAYLPTELARGERRAGLYASLYAIHSERSWGCGDFADLERLTAWLAREAGGSFVALNPLHAIHNRVPYNTSPYLPVSIFYRNFIYLDIERIEDYQRSPWAQRLRSSSKVTDEVRELNADELVEYARVAKLKKLMLKLAFRQFLRENRQGGVRAREFQEFVAREGELLHRYSVYCALDEWIHKRNPDVWSWNQWPAEYQTPDSEATRLFAKQHHRKVEFHKYVQWLIDLQLMETQTAARRNGLSIGLFHDLALAVDRYGADLWAYRPFFVDGCRVGAPPDDFSPNGQDWSFPPPATDRHFEDGYQLFRESIRKSCRRGGALRIDHVMRFFRLFWIPAGKTPAAGAYVRDRYEDLIRVLALESVRNEVIVVGEDLGTVEPKIRETLAKYGILSYRVFYFEKNKQGEFRSPIEYPKQALVASTTHDLPTLAGFWSGRDIEARHDAGILPDEQCYVQAMEDRRREKQRILDVLVRNKLLPGNHRSIDEFPELTTDLHRAVIGFLVSTPGVLLAINQEDLTKEVEQQNLPGTTAEHPNWRRKMRYSIDELESSDSVREMVVMLRGWLRRSGRLDRASNCR